MKLFCDLRFHIDHEHKGYTSNWNDPDSDRTMTAQNIHFQYSCMCVEEEKYKSYASQIKSQFKMKIHLIKQYSGAYDKSEFGVKSVVTPILNGSCQQASQSNRQIFVHYILNAHFVEITSIFS